jgi:acetylornithine deacetylase
MNFHPPTLRQNLISTLSELIRIPSENTPPMGAEYECQKYLHERLQEIGLTSDLYYFSDIENLKSHPAYRHQRDYTNRPNVAGTLRGSGGGKSLLFSGHIDTVPIGTEKWVHDPFGAEIEGNRLYGRGSNDMKGGIAASLVAIETIINSGIKLKGDVIFESVVDEEFGGVNGTLAARLRGYHADAVIVTEPSQNIICPAHLGGRIVHVTFRSNDGGILEEGKSESGVTDQLHYFLGELKNFAKLRKAQAPIHPLYSMNDNPVPVWVLKINAGGWGMEVPTTIPAICRVELYWQQVPGEKLEDIDLVFSQWLEEMINARPDLFQIKPEAVPAIEWLPGSGIEINSPLVTQLSDSFREVTGKLPVVQGFNAPCDMFIFHQYFKTPALIFGPTGGNTHQPDEWVDLDSLVEVTETLIDFIVKWCNE